MGYGDEIVAAGEAQRWFDATGKRSVIVDRDGRRRWHPIWEGNPIIVRPGEDAGDYYTIMNAAYCRPYIVYPFTAERGWVFNRGFKCREHIAKIYLTDDERHIGATTRMTYGRYVLIEPWSKHVNLRWPREYWQQLVRTLSHITFVQHTHPQTDYVIDGAIPVPATFRDACGLLTTAALYVRGESGLCHAAAALGRPQLTIWGACMDADVMAYYPQQLVVENFGDQPPCGSWKPCDHCAAAMRGISVERVAQWVDAAWDSATH